MPKLLSKQRIRQAAEFDSVIQQGKSLTSGCFVLFRKPTQLDYSRLGIIVSKKHCRLAVNRNRLKRIIREQFRLHQQNFLGVDVVIMLKSPADRWSAEERTQCIKNLFSS
ncbi:MAG TPA: ribonuclease P protein component [Coxiellaceae bacterium]|nr:ribonuclease P protein component [Coxiellaceae bacterium]